ncbi:aminotransferase class V-fold PLP-dependent enzyme [Oculatella sp. LEGE 06141]|uniref:trans-sulfuration enzyme family protein n=1 Tax=Oculatella sp. LEGE 06141 TaxID=1828648 RepID=UPI00188148EF|nr:aminotransferase class V-fold PLP-dependent enzyme [Oculatella sp. LEGE 06141]MBE9177377.1 aminotransferase class V-fold PLP-dependent enzyme [Oculatella sp. LEGE 06141]
MRIETLAIHAGRNPDPATGAIAPPIYLSTTFEREADGSYPHDYLYTRTNNPNRASLEQCLTALEGGVAAAAFASGSAATAAVFQALAPGDHVIAPNEAYSGTPLLLNSVFATWGLEVTFVDMTCVAEVQQAIQPNTRLLWIETPSNPMLKITNLSEITALAHQTGAICVCDNTWATPLLQQPFQHGVDLVVHSTTKYLSGHSDVLGGAVIARTDSERFQTIRHLQTTGGAVPSPFDCWLTLRGIQTLPYRVKAHADHAYSVAKFLHQHPAVEAVHYPGLPHHPGHSVAVEQMRGFGGMLSVQIKGGRDRAFAVAANVKLFSRATSLGSVESLIEHRASIEGAGTRTPDNLLRLSIGLEHPDDLIADLEQALN